MQRGDLYRVHKGTKGDPRGYRVFVIVSRQLLVDSRFSTLTCAPVYSLHDGLSTQVKVGVEEGLKKDCSIHCDELISISKSLLTDFIGRISPAKLLVLDKALKVALALEN